MSFCPYAAFKNLFGCCNKGKFRYHFPTTFKEKPSKTEQFVERIAQDGQSDYQKLQNHFIS